MTDFVHSLHAFRNGNLSREGLFAEVDRQLSQPQADPVTMLAILDDEHAEISLPEEVHGALAQKILLSLSAPAPAASPGLSPVFKDTDDSATITIDDYRSGSRRKPGFKEVDPGHSPSNPIGSILQGRFKLMGRIGEGGMSSVFKAIDLRKVEARSTDPYVAVKLLTFPDADYSGALALLQREAQRLQSLAHPNIVRVIDCDRDGLTVFMTMEFLSGETLKRKYFTPEFQGLPVEQALPIIESIASALAFAHANGVVHGDLKPGNVIVTNDGHVKVIDFGIARLMTQSRDPRADWTTTGLTPSYASPEMLENRLPDPRDDEYALACIVYEMLTGQHPFERNPATAARDQGMKAQLREGISRRQLKAVRRALDFDRESRTPSVDRFLHEFRGDTASYRRRVALWSGFALLGMLGVLAGLYALRHGRPSVSPASQKSTVGLVARPAYSVGEVFRDCPTCPLMKVLPPGRFRQGSPQDDPDALPAEAPAHAVALGYPLSMAVNEVTGGEFKEFIEATGRKVTGCTTYDGTWHERADRSWDNPGFTQTPLHPVACVSWLDAADYVSWLSAKTAKRYRLPSASEWEYAARAGSDAPRAWGSNLAQACTQANVADESAAKTFPGWRVHPCSDGYVFSAPVGSYASNAFGLNDMLGNVFEWVQDCWHEDYTGAPADGSAWLNGDCSQREMRGGSWFTIPAFVRVAYRNRFPDTYRSSSVGFRIVREMRE
jgi:formylglycine-generating enzyme required for sulfatase activity/predicted Ser/Thr protein kinase